MGRILLAITETESENFVREEQERREGIMNNASSEREGITPAAKRGHPPRHAPNDLGVACRADHIDVVARASKPVSCRCSAD